MKASLILLTLSVSATSLLSQTKPLPTGVRLDPAGDNIKVGNMLEELNPAKGPGR